MRHHSSTCWLQLCWWPIMIRNNLWFNSGHSNCCEMYINVGKSYIGVNSQPLQHHHKFTALPNRTTLHRIFKRFCCSMFAFIWKIQSHPWSRQKIYQYIDSYLSTVYHIKLPKFSLDIRNNFFVNLKRIDWKDTSLAIA